MVAAAGALRLRFRCTALRRLASAEMQRFSLRPLQMATQGTRGSTQKRAERLDVATGPRPRDRRALWTRRHGRRLQALVAAIHLNCPRGFSPENQPGAGEIEKQSEKIGQAKRDWTSGDFRIQFESV
jgi:hypothetical protein